jgi:hypothetical protein
LTLLTRAAMFSRMDDFGVATLIISLIAAFLIGRMLRQWRQR